MDMAYLPFTFLAKLVQVQLFDYVAVDLTKRCLRWLILPRACDD